jgi:DNA-directed RNA polymerase subunit beta
MSQQKIHREMYGTTERMTFSKIKDVLEIPYLIEVQKDSYKNFLDTGIREVFADYSPIHDYSDRYELAFLDYKLDGEPKYSVRECKSRDTTYAIPLRVMVRLTNKETGQIVEQEVFMGDLPLMTESGSFIINGAERVIVSQLVRSPGIYSDVEQDKNGVPRFKTTVIPNRGAWLEFEQDQNDVLWVHVDRTRKITATTLLRTLGLGTDEEILKQFANDAMIDNTCNKDTNAHLKMLVKIDLFRRLRPAEVPTIEGASILINNIFFDPRRYDLARVGRHKFNKKLSIASRIAGFKSAANIVSPITGEILAEKGEIISVEAAEEIQNNAINEVDLLFTKEDGSQGIFRCIGNNTVDLEKFIDFSGKNKEFSSPKSLGIVEKVYYPALKEILDNVKGDKERMQAIKANAEDLVVKHITLEDIMATVSINVGLRYGFGDSDCIDHLANRRVRSVGELLQNQFRIGISRLERVIKERMSIAQEEKEISPQTLINIRPVTSAIKEFFGSSQLSQFMDQPNPIAELTHKRKLSALGPGGLNRERASFDVRDVHHTHYGRMCPIETPEGQNIGLITSLSTYARVNEYGFIETPYRKVDKKRNVVTEEVEWLPADVEDRYIVAQANEPLDEQGHFINPRVTCRLVEMEFKKEKGYRVAVDKIKEVEADKIDYMDVFSKAVGFCCYRPYSIPRA